jgi:hypothetical protein
MLSLSCAVRVQIKMCSNPATTSHLAKMDASLSNIFQSRVWSLSTICARERYMSGEHFLYAWWHHRKGRWTSTEYFHSYSLILLTHHLRPWHSRQVAYVPSFIDENAEPPPSRWEPASRWSYSDDLEIERGSLLVRRDEYRWSSP